MTAPDTNVKKETRRHWPALIGIAVAVLAVGFAVLALPILPDSSVTVMEGEAGPTVASQ